MKTQAEASDSSPRVSVLMAAYNCAAYVGEAIQSVLAQTMPDLELILIDDGSTDRSPEIIASYAARDARVVMHRQENQGIGAATNQALRLARAPYVAILDSDDIMLPERLAIQANYLDQHADIAAVGSQWFTMNTRGDILGIDRQPTDPETLSTLMYAYFAMHHPTIMARKQPILDCGGYATKIKQGCMDYGVFFDLLLAGYRMTNLPHLLTRWRFNPSGATHGNARPQTEDCASIRNKAFMKMAALDEQRADQIALALVRAFPAGSWFDDKVSHLLPNALPSPALLRWNELAKRGSVPQLEAACVDWLHNEVDHAERLARLLTQEGSPWLAELVRGKAGRPTTTPNQTAGHKAASSSATALSLLIPTHAGDDELQARIRSSLDTLPENAEIIIFSTDGSVADIPATLLHSALRMLPAATQAGLAWQQALSGTRGEFIACLAAGCTHHPQFLSESLAALRANARLSLVYGPTDIYYPDALDCNGHAVKDPSPEPRWTQQTLLGQDRGDLSCMMFRRKLINAIPVAIEETGVATSWAIARSLLIRAEPHILPLRNSQFAAKIGLANNIMEVLTRRLLTWYLDSGSGSIPAPAVWPELTVTQGLTRVRELDAKLLEKKFCVHPENVSLIAEFVIRFSRMPISHPVFKHLLMQYPAVTIAAMRKRSILAAHVYIAGRVLLRGYARARKALGLRT